MKFLYFFVPILLFSLISCSGQPDVQTKTVNLTPIQMAIPDGNADTVTWFPDQTLRVFYNQGKGPYIEYAAVGDSTIERVMFDSMEPCRYTRYLATGPLMDGRLGLIYSCTDRWPENPQPYRNADYMVAYNWETQSLDRLVDIPLSNRLFVGFFSWNPEMSRGVQQIAGDRGTIWWMTPEGSEPMDIVIGEGERSWSLAENLDILYDVGDIYLNEYDVGNAREPVWSPDGKTIAFLASPDAIGRGGINRMASPYGIYLMDPEIQEPIVVLEGLIEPHFMRWSPDSQWLAFSTAFRNINKRYLGLFSPANKQLYLIPNSPDATSFESLAWSPSGEEIAVLEWTKADTLGSEQWRGTIELLIYDVKSLISQTKD